MAAGPALAQTATTPAQEPETSELDEVIVTGYRQSIEASLEQKREANAFVEVITAEDIGRFPDKNVADSLQRVPGVIISRDGGEGARVSIRGLQSDLTLTQLNGNYVASADSSDPSRSFNYVLLPSNMISSVEVFKSSEARIDEGGVGGTVILHTRRPLGMPANSGFLAAEGTYADTTEEIEPQVSGLFSWRNEADNFGLLVGATYQSRTNRSMEASTESWRWWTDDRSTQPATDVNGDTYANDDAISYWWGGGTTTQSGTHYSGYWVPQSVNAAVREEERERLGLQATAQWRPSDNLLVTANYFRFDLSGDYNLSILKIPEWGYGNFFAGATLDPSNTIFTSATFQVPTGGCSNDSPPCTMETPQIAAIYSREEASSQTFDLNLEYDVDNFEADFKIGHTEADGGPSMLFQVAAKPRFTSSTQGVNGNFLSVWDFSSGDLRMQFSPEIQANLMAGIAQIDAGSTHSSFVNSTLEQDYAQADFTNHLDGFWSSINYGVKYRKGQVHRHTGNTLWYANPQTQQRYQETPEAGVAQPEFFRSQPIGNIPGGFSTNIFPAFDTEAYIAYLNGRYGEPVRRIEPNFVFDIEEEIWSGYVQGNFETDRLRGNVGVRVAQTKQFGQSTDLVTYFEDYYLDGPAGPLGPPALGPDGQPIVLPEAQRFHEAYILNGQDKSYTDVLPSLNIAYDLTDDLVLRAAASKVISRPGYSNLGSQLRLEHRSAAYAADRGQFGEREGWRGSGGNKDLEPYEAWQYDVGLEWYFQPGSVVGATLFRKDVSSFIVPLVIDTVLTVDGQQVTVEPFSTNANGTDAVSQGIELYAQHTFDFGLGFQANFTYNDTSVTDITVNGEVVGESPLVGSAETQANVSVFYETDTYLVRASYNRRGEVVGGLQSGLNVISDPYDQIDLNASYNITDDLVLTGSIINLTKSEQRAHLGDDTEDRFFSNVYAGRRAYVGLSYKF